MKLADLFQDLDEDLTRRAALGGLGALLGTGSVQAKSSATDQAPSYVHAHINDLLPLVIKVNEEIKSLRDKIKSLVSLGDGLSAGQKQWLNHIMEVYNADNTEDLLKRVDVIPPSLAIAQSALESQWGRDIKARRHNVLFGQVGGPKGSYARHSTKLDAVRSYMHNLNTHPAYSSLRNLRAETRRRGQSPTGTQLVRGLERYSTSGDYVAQVRQMIDSFGIKSLDAHN